MKNYYNILGVTKNADKEEIKKAYRKLALKHHPDKTGGDDSKFKEINEAYQILSNDQKRQEYDTYGRVFSDGQNGAQSEGNSGFDFSGFDFSQFGGQNNGQSNFDFGDIFEGFFGGGQQTRKQGKRGRDIFIDLEISFEDSVFGLKRTVLLNKNSFCDKCSGKGAEPGTETKKCEHCAGAGKVHETRKSFLGSFTTLRECSNCHGRGTIPSKKCTVCHGEGTRMKNEEITIQVPSGIENGEMIKMTGIGEAITQGVAGDLYAKIHVLRHPTYRREGSNLLMDLEIKMTDALVGVEKDIKTLDNNNLTVKIPSGVDNGEILRVRGRGIPTSKNSRGDLLIKIVIRTPKKISNKARQLIEELKEEGI